MADESSSSPESVPSRTTGGHFRWEPPTAAELQELMPGYMIEKLLGRGGMGAVYRGVQTNLDRPVAIKILPPGIEKEDPSFAERFKSEARLMAKLNHPGVVAVYDFGTTSAGQLYFAMEYVDGSDVSQLLHEKGRLPPEHALAITAHVCDALGAAHELGIVHRDIKPANILINMKGQVKVADFGLAKIEDPGQHGLTKTGYAMGTPDFVSPEVLMLGSHIDGRADLYAVGVMLYQMLTGNVPRGAFKPASVLRSTLDPRYDPIITKAMQHDREDRYQTAAELRRALDVILTTPYIAPEATSAVAAVPPPKAEVMRTAPPQRRVPQPVRQAAPAPPPQRQLARKSTSGLWLGISAIVLVLGGLAFMFMEPAKPKAKSNAVTPQPRMSPPPVAAKTPRLSSSTEPWVDRMQDPVFATKNTATREGATWRLSKHTIFFLPEVMTDGAVRLLCSVGSGATKSGVSLRIAGSTGAASADGYHLQFQAGGPSIEIHRKGNTSNIAQGRLHYPASVPKEFFGHPIEVELRAVSSRITAKVNGEIVGSADHAAFKSGLCRMALSEGTIIHDVQTLDLSKKPVPAAVAPSPATAAKDAAAPEQWVDLLQMYFALPADQQRSTVIERVPEGARLKAKAAFHLPGGGRQNFVLRATVRGLKDWLTLVVRSSGSDREKTLRYYQAKLNSDGTGRLSRTDGPQPPTGFELARFGPIPGFDPAARHTLEFRAVDDVLTVIVDGQAMESVQDATLEKGGLSITGDPGMIIEKLEMADLSAQLPAAGSAAASVKDNPSVPAITGWQDAMESIKDHRDSKDVISFTEENGWLVATHSNVGLFPFDSRKTFAGTAVRGRLRGIGGIHIRSFAKGAYVVMFNGKGAGWVEHRIFDAKATRLARFTTSDAPEHDFLITMTGPDIRVWVDGVLAATAADSQIEKGRVMLSLLDKSAAIRGLAVAGLPAGFLRQARRARGQSFIAHSPAERHSAMA